MIRTILFAFILPIAFTTAAQTPTKKPVTPSPRAVQATSNAPTSEQLTQLSGLRADVARLEAQIALAQAESDKLTGGLIKALIESRIATLGITEALLQQKIKAIETGAKMTIEVYATVPDTSAATTIESEIATQRLRIDQMRIDADRYSGGLIKVQKESTIATMENTVAMLEQRALTAKFGLGLPSAGKPRTTSTLQTGTTQTKSAPRPVLQNELISVRLLNKRVVKEKYGEGIYFDFEYTGEKLKQATRAIKGSLNFNDLFGETKMSLSATIDKTLSQGQSVAESGKGFKYNQFLSEHHWMRDTDLSNMTATFTVKSILYDDGTREDF